MKRIFTLLLFVAVNLYSYSYDVCVNGIYYNFITNANNEAVVTYRSMYAESYSGDIVIPETFTYNDQEYTVKSIMSSAFIGCSNLTSIEIPNTIVDIGGQAFANCSKLKTVVIGNSVKYIGAEAFGNCAALTNFSCYASIVPTTDCRAFDNTPIGNATLDIPMISFNDYKATEPWNQFGTIRFNGGSDIKKCATPTISFENGGLVFSTETEGAEIVSEIVVPDMRKSYGNFVPLYANYHIGATATKPGYYDSNVATATLHWMSGTIDTTTGTQEFGAKRAVLVSSSDGFVTVSGLNDGEKVEAFSTDGKCIVTTYAVGNVINIATKSGDTIVLKIGNETIKTMVK